MKLQFGRYDYACFFGFSSYAWCSLIIPIALVVLARDLAFPLEDGGMGAGGVLHAMRSVTMLVALLCCGLVAARIGKRWSLGLSMLLMGLGIGSCAFARSYGMLLPGILFAGIGEGLCEGIATPFVHDMHKDDPGGYVNTAHSFWSVGTGSVVIVAGYLLTRNVHWRLIVALAGLFCLASSLGFLWRERPGKEYPEASSTDGYGDVFHKTRAIIRSGRFWVYCLGMFVGAGAEFGLTFWSASYVQLHFHTSPWIGGLGTAFLALGMFVGRFCYGRYVPEGRLGHLLLATGFGGIPVSALFLLVRPDSFGGGNAALAAIFALLFLAGLCVAPYWPSLQVLGVDTLPALDSTMLYVYFSAIGIPGCGIFTWLMGAIGDRWGLNAGLITVPVSMFCFGMIILLSVFVFKPCYRTAHQEGN